MLEIFTPQSTAELFVDYLDKLIINHYGILYPKKKHSPIDQTFLFINAILGKTLFAALGKEDYPIEEIASYPIFSQVESGVSEKMFRSWRSLNDIGMIIQYCDRIDALARSRASKKAEGNYFLACPLSTHRVEIQEKSFFLLRQKTKGNL